MSKTNVLELETPLVSLSTVLMRASYKSARVSGLYFGNRYQGYISGTRYNAAIDGEETSIILDYEHVFVNLQRNARQILIDSNDLLSGRCSMFLED